MHRMLYFEGIGVIRYNEGEELEIGDSIGSWPSEWIVTSYEINRDQDWQRAYLSPRVYSWETH